MSKRLSAIGETDDGINADARERIRAALAEKPDCVLEAIARDAGVPTQCVLESTPERERREVPTDRFDEIWRDMTEWGTILFIVHTPDIVLECAGSLPTGAYSQGYFNLSGASPIHGHIKVDHCRAIYLVDRLFHGRRSCSAQFFNAAGEAMFKIFVGRDDARELITEQVARFEALWRRMQSSSVGDITGAPV